MTISTSSLKFSKYNIIGKLESGSYLIYNLLSSAIAILSKKELEELSRNDIPSLNLPLYTQARDNGFLVPKLEDETSKVMALRNINNYRCDVAGFQIMPTTRCNASCFYCYEHNYIHENMSETTADATTDFIADFCSDIKHLYITWFGGEPFFNEEIIARISENLIPKIENQGIKYSANAITNGSLISIKKIKTLKETYHISKVQITIDGHGKEYLIRKKYRNGHISYEKIINTIEELTKNEIFVIVRLNIDRNNIESCLEAISDLSRADIDIDYITIYAAPLYSSVHSDNTLASDELASIFKKVFLKLIEHGFITSLNGLPMNFKNASCSATMLNNYVITASGDIFKCDHIINDTEEKIGDVFNGIAFTPALSKWLSSEIPETCKDCKYLPICQTGCVYSEKAGQEYGRCSYITYIDEAILSAANNLLNGGII